MDRIEGNDNYTIKGSNSHIGDLTQNIETVNINLHHIKDTKNNDTKELEPFFEIGVQKSPLFNQRYFFASGLTFVVADYFISRLHTEMLFSIALHLVVVIALWGFHMYLSNTLFDLVYIKENEVVIGQKSFAYKIIRDPKATGGEIRFGFNNNSDWETIHMHKDAAGLLKHKIEAYHKHYGLNS